MKIGVILDSFCMPLEEAMTVAKAIGVDGVQMYTSASMSKEQLAEVGRMASDSGLEVSALCAEFGGGGFMFAEQNAERIDRSKRAMDEALELGANVVSAHIGVVPADESNPRYSVMAKACEQLGAYGREVGAWYAIETGPEKGETLGSFIDDIGLDGGLGVNFDPANLVMVVQDDVPAAVEALGKYIVHTHAKDGRNTNPDLNPEITYGAVPCPEGTEQWGGFEEVPLGEGDVPWAEYLAALRNVGYDGYLTIEREVGDNPRADIELAVGFLAKQLGR